MIYVIGGGITGRLVAHAIGLLDRHSVQVIDWGAPPQSTQRRFLTRAFGANYLWKPLPSLSCRSFDVFTHVDGTDATDESIRAYKRKVGKLDDGGDWGLQFAPLTTGYELNEFPEPKIDYGVRIVEIDPVRQRFVTSRGEIRTYDYLVSTIPIYSLVEMIEYPPLVEQLQLRLEGRIHSIPIYVKIIARPPDAPFPQESVYVNYLSSPTIQPYRFCDRGRERHFESLTVMATIPTKKLFPGKLIPPYPDWQPIRQLLSEYRITAFGRYATWSPDELVHQTYEHITQWVTSMERL